MSDVEVGLEPWGEGDLGLLRRLNAPEMTEHLGGPETEAKVVERHERYLRMRREGPGEGPMFRIVLQGGGEAMRCNDWRLDLTLPG